jgi:hypothetical protein
MYIIDDNKVVACGYATFDVTQFPLKKMLLAGQSLPQDFAIDTESFRKNGFKHPQDLDDDQVAEYATRLRLTLELPPGFVKDYPGPWRAQCSLTRHVRKTLHVVLLLDRYHGDARKAPMIMRLQTRKKVAEVVIPVQDSSNSSRRNLRYLLATTYPDCKTLSDMARASNNNKAILPTHPAVAVQQVVNSHASIMLQDPDRHQELASPILAKLRVPPITLAPKQAKLQGAIGFVPASRSQAKRHPSWPLWQAAEDNEIAGLENKKMWKVVDYGDVPAGTPILWGQFVYADKTTGPKARYVVCGNGEFPIQPRSETYSGTPPCEVNRGIIAYTAANSHELWKFDVNQAFTQSEKFSDDVHIYVHPPPGYLPKGKVLKLLGPLYGLRRASACWSKTVRCFLISIMWSKVIDNDDTVWFKYVPTDDGKGNKIMLLEFHVDDFLLSAHPSCSVARDEFRKAFIIRYQSATQKMLQ